MLEGGSRRSGRGTMTTGRDPRSTSVEGLFGAVGVARKLRGARIFYSRMGVGRARVRVWILIEASRVVELAVGLVVCIKYGSRLEMSLQMTEGIVRTGVAVILDDAERLALK